MRWLQAPHLQHTLQVATPTLTPRALPADDPGLPYPPLPHPKPSPSARVRAGVADALRIQHRCKLKLGSGVTLGAQAHALRIPADASSAGQRCTSIHAPLSLPLGVTCPLVGTGTREVRLLTAVAIPLHPPREVFAGDEQLARRCAALARDVEVAQQLGHRRTRQTRPPPVGHLVGAKRPCTAMKKLRIVRLGVGTW